MTLHRYGYLDELVKVELAEGHFTKAGDIYLAHMKYLSLSESFINFFFTKLIYEEAANCYTAGKEPTKAASCYVKKAQSLEVEQWTHTVLSKKLNANAMSFEPGKSQVYNAQSGAASFDPGTIQVPNNATQPEIVNSRPVVESLLKAQQVLAGNETSDKIAFEVGI